MVGGGRRSLPPSDGGGGAVGGSEKVCSGQSKGNKLVDKVVSDEEHLEKTIAARVETTLRENAVRSADDPLLADSVLGHQVGNSFRLARQLADEVLLDKAVTERLATVDPALALEVQIHLSKVRAQQSGLKVVNELVNDTLVEGTMTNSGSEPHNGVGLLRDTQTLEVATVPLPKSTVEVQCSGRQDLGVRTRSQSARQIVEEHLKVPSWGNSVDSGSDMEQIADKAMGLDVDKEREDLSMSSDCSDAEMETYGSPLTDDNGYFSAEQEGDQMPNAAMVSEAVPRRSSLLDDTVSGNSRANPHRVSGIMVNSDGEELPD